MTVPPPAGFTTAAELDHADVEGPTLDLILNYLKRVWRVLAWAAGSGRWAARPSARPPSPTPPTASTPPWSTATRPAPASRPARSRPGMSDVRFAPDLSATLVDHMGSDDSIVHAMLVSTLGGASLDATASAGRIGAMMRNRHGSPFEHCSMTFLVRAPIMVFREFHRHRIGWSYNEMSGRYRELPDDFYLPPRHRPLVQTGKAIEYNIGPELDDERYEATLDDLQGAYIEAYAAYLRILERGHAKEIARACLPVGLYTEMYATCNARSLMSFLSLRTNEPTATFPSKPQWEIEQIARAMEAAFADLFPLTYDAYVTNGRVAP